MMISKIITESDIESHVIYKAHIPNIIALNSDTHTLRTQYEYTQKQCVGVAIEGMDIWYMGITTYELHQKIYQRSNNRLWWIDIYLWNMYKIFDEKMWQQVFDKNVEKVESNH